MEVTQDGLTEEEQNKLEFQENFGENEMTDCQAKDNIIELENVVIIENKEKDMEANAFGEIKVPDQSIKNSSALEELENLTEVNLSDVYSNEKFGHDLLQYIENGHSLENWHQGYQDAATDSFSSHMQIESVPIGPIQECVNANIQSTSESTLTLTVLNSTNNDENSQPISFSFAQSSKHGSNTGDHDYCTMYPKSEFSGADNYHGSMDNMRPQQYEMEMDQEKLLRMKRRKEKNRECSRQFRLKQKTKEENLKKGKIEKLQNLENLKRNVENLKIALSRVAAQCSLTCPKTRMLLSQHTLVDKENINPDFMKTVK